MKRRTKKVMHSKDQTLKTNLDFVLRELMNQFIANIQGFSACLLTEDGLIIAEGNNSGIEQNISSEELGAITASMISIAEQAVLHYKSSQNLSQFTIETSNLENPERGGLSIFAYQIHPNVLFAYNYPSSIPKGLITFERSKAIKDIQAVIYGNETELMRSIGSMI